MAEELYFNIKSSEKEVGGLTVSELSKSERLKEINVELEHVKKAYHRLFKRVYDEDSPKDIRDIAYSLLFGRDDPRKVARLDRLGKRITDLMDKQERHLSQVLEALVERDRSRKVLGEIKKGIGRIKKW